MKMWGQMRTIKVSPRKFENAVSNMGRDCKFIPIPSTNRKSVFTGLIKPGGAWVSWPQTIEEDPENGLTEEEMRRYIETYGNIPDLFTPRHR